MYFILLYHFSIFLLKTFMSTVDFSEATGFNAAGLWGREAIPEEGLAARKFPQTGNAWKVRNASCPLWSLDPGPAQL